jgi:hypothetical protein
VPVTTPVDDDWAITTGEQIHNNARRKDATTTTRLLNIQLPPGWAMPGPVEL